MKRQGKRRDDEPLLRNLRAIARSEERDWDEENWRRVVRRATTAPDGARPAPKPRPVWAWAYAAVLLVLLGAAGVAVRDFFRAAGPGLPAGGAGGPLGEGRLIADAGGGPAARQDQLSVALVSSESGLKVYWYFDKEFVWEEKNP